MVDEHYDIRRSRARRTRRNPIRGGAGVSFATQREPTPCGPHDTGRPPATRGPPRRDRRVGDRRPSPSSARGAIRHRRRPRPAPDGRPRAAAWPGSRTAGRPVTGAFARSPTRSRATRAAGRSCRWIESAPGRCAAGCRRRPSSPTDRSTRRSGASPSRAPRSSRSARARRRPSTRRGRPCPAAGPPRARVAHRGRAGDARLTCRSTAPRRCRGVATLYARPATPPRPAAGAGRTGRPACTCSSSRRSAAGGRAAGPARRRRHRPRHGASRRWFVSLVVRGPD